MSGTFFTLIFLLTVIVAVFACTKSFVASTTCAWRKLREFGYPQVADSVVAGEEIEESEEAKPQTKHESWPEEANWSVYDEPAWKRKGLVI